jgi:protein-S-isoprenylcysteine O-methyltransferase Ste14
MNVFRRIIGDASEAGSKVLVAGLFLALAWRFGIDFAETYRPTDLLLLVGAALVVILTCLRRSARMIDRRWTVRIVTFQSLLLPLLVVPAPNTGLVTEAAAASLTAFGLAIVVGGKLSLGRSFGMLPANRGVMEGGLYRIVRHPIYLGYIVTHVPFLAAHPSAWNLAVLIAGDAALVVRALYEEQTLGHDPQYVRYCQSVKWRLVPGIC